jgi:hypothetical protein
MAMTRAAITVAMRLVIEKPRSRVEIPPVFLFFTLRSSLTDLERWDEDEE